MFKKEESNAFSTSKENEKLRERLKSLIKQHELKHNKKDAKSLKTGTGKEHLQSHQVNGESETKPKQNVKKKQKGVELNKPKQEKKTNKASTIERDPTQKSANGFSNSSNNKGGTNTKKQKLNKLNKTQSSETSAKKTQPKSEKVQHPKENRKNKKRQDGLFTNSQNQKETEAFKGSISHKVPLANGQQKLSKNQKKKAKKRAATTAFSQQANDSKKAKLTPGPGIVPTQNKSKKKSKHLPKKGPFKDKLIPDGSSDELDIGNMPGFVRGGDFDAGSVDEDDTYWMQQDKDSSNESEENANEDFGNDPYNYADEDGEESDNEDPYDYSDADEDELDNNSEDSENQDPYDYSDFVEEEEEEHYSDFDEDDYEEDEDSYDYSDSEFSSNFGEEEDTEHSYDFNDEDDDEDYKLPDNVPEDLIVHSGTATKRDIQPEDNIVFKDKKHCQIIELEEQNTVKVVQQLKAYEKEELVKLTYRENHTVKLVTSNEDEESKSSPKGEDDCPKLVPIVDEDGFELYNPDQEEDSYECEDVESLGSENTEMDSDEADDYDDYSSMDSASLGSEYIEVNSDDADSLMSEDINEKYLNRDRDDYYSSDDEHLATRKTADLIDATNCDYAGQNEPKQMDETDESLQDDDVGQLPSQRLFKHVKVGSKGSILSTTIIEHKEESDLTESLNDIELKKTSDNLKSDIIKTSPHAKELPDGLSESGKNKENQTESNQQTKESPTRPKGKSQSLTNYNTLFCNAIDANLVLVLLKDPFYIYGTVRLTLLAGTVDLYGHPLAVNQEVEIFSPRGCSVIEISAKTSEDNKTCSKATLKTVLKDYKSNFVLADLEKITKSYEAGKDAVVLMKRNEARKKMIEQFKKFMNENVFPNLQNISLDRPLHNSEYLLRCIINTSATEQKCLRLPDQWQLLALSKKSRVLLAGGKGVGKSTLLRYLVNKHILQHERVLLIDLDIGQPEIFIPQTVSCAIVRKPLLGPGFFLNIQPEKAYAVGHTNIALCPHKYVKAVFDLIRYCVTREDFKDIPWLVNTMGYNKGFGLELISVIVRALPLTDVVQLQSNKDINNYESMLFPDIVNQIPPNMFVDENDSSGEENSPKPSYRLHVWQSAVAQDSRYQKEWDMSPKDLRYAMLLTRLSVGLQGHADWLTDCKPLSAPLDQLRLVNLMDNIPPYSKDELAKAMEANLVHLCHYESEQNSIECLGIGVVRAIDYHVRQVYLLPAMAASLLKRVNCLALGDMPLPNSIFTNQGSRVKNAAPFVYNTIEANASKAVKQIYHRPRAFLSGKHKSLD